MSKWTDEEIALLKAIYPSEGVSGCRQKLKSRTDQAIRGKAFSLGITLISGSGTKHTHEWYEAELFRKEIDHYPIEQYKGYDTPIQHECLNGHITLRSPNNVLRKSDCTVCIGINKKTTSIYEKELIDLGIIYLPLESYIDTDTSILHSCPQCTNKWKARPSHILAGHGCPKCRRPGGYNFTYFENNPEIANNPGACYLVVLIDKDTNKKIAYKIGITKGSSNKDVLKRVKHFKEYEARILKVHFDTLLNVFSLEQQLHTKWAQYKMLPDKKFGGWQECFELNDMIVKTFPNV